MATPGTLARFGEGAVLIDLCAERAPDRAARTHAAAAGLRARFPEADVVTGAGTVLVVGATPSSIERAIAEGAIAEGAIAEGAIAEGAIDRASGDAHALPPAREHVIATVYDGPDLHAAAASLGLHPEALIERHTALPFIAELLGFLPGFAYLGPLDPSLVLARRLAPRPSVPAGSVAIAGGFTGIYPFASPGGWTLIGRALEPRLFDPTRAPPGRVQPGDRVRFVRVTDEATARAASEVAASAIDRAIDRPAGPGLRIVAAHAPITVQDRGRAGWLGRGLSPSGALAPGLLARANAAVGNDLGAAGLEVPLGSLEIASVGESVVSIDGEPAERLGDGERRRFPSSTRAVQYLALRGGVDVPVVLGARATLPVARLGGLAGRALRKGDFLPAGHLHGAASTALTPHVDPVPDRLDVDPGPHLARFPEGALEALLTATFTVSPRSDRVGVRLDGARIPRDRPDLALPVPMRRGAMQVTTDGTPIVLGPDHPTTGGYPVLAVLRPEAQEALAWKRPGEPVRFRLAGVR